MLLKYEREIDFPRIVRSNEPSVLKLKQESFETLLGFVTMCVKNYLEYSFPSQVGIAAMFANDLIETRPTWKAADFVNLFKFFRQRMDTISAVNSDPNCVIKKPDNENLKVFGNTITPQKLMEMVAVYEEHRAVEFEKFVNETRGEYQNPGERSFSDDSIKGQLGRMMEATSAKQEEKRMKGQLHERKVTSDENYFQREHGAPKDAA